MTRPNTHQVEFEEIYRREFSNVYGFLYRQGAPSAELPDLAHDVFATVIRKWATFDNTRPVRPWLLGIAWRVMSDFRSKAKPELVDELPEAIADINPDASLEARDAQRLITQALSTLDEVKRAVFVLHELQGLSVAEVAEAMNASLQTTYSRLRVAREEMAIAVRRIRRGTS